VPEPPPDRQNGSEKFRPFRWTAQREQVAALLAEDELTDEEIGRRCGITDRQIRKWKHHPEFKARVLDAAREVGDVALRRAISRRARRVSALQDRWDRMAQVITDRAADPSMRAVPGGATGLLVRQVKSIGSGPAAHEVEEFEVDTGLLRELREHEKQAAQELGQWTERREHSGPEGAALPVIGIRVLAANPGANGHAADHARR
jgi:transposase-like protein